MATQIALVKISSKVLEKLTPQEFRTVRRLTIPEASAMRDVLDGVTTYEYEKSGIRCFLAYNDLGRIVAWSMVLPYCSYPSWSKNNFIADPKDKQRVGSGIYIFVSKKYRRQGLGRQLLKRSTAYAKRKADLVRVHPWDSTSRQFYDKVTPRIKNVKHVTW